MCYFKIKRKLLSVLLTFVARLENKIWRELYTTPRRYCKCQVNKMSDGLSPHKDMYK